MVQSARADTAEKSSPHDYCEGGFPFRAEMRARSPGLTLFITGTCVQVGADQFIAAPCLVGLFFTAMPVLEGKPQEIKPRLAEVGRSQFPVSSF